MNALHQADLGVYRRKTHRGRPRSAPPSGCNPTRVQGFVATGSKLLKFAA